MLNGLWLGLMIASVLLGVFNGTIDQVVLSVTQSAKLAFEIALGLVGLMALWSGIMKLAESSGLTHIFARLLNPIMCKLFPEVPADHPAMGAMLMNISANMLGLANAATPFGLKAMQELDKLNKIPGTATNAMCTFLAINTSSVQIIPATAIAMLAAGGSRNPTVIIISSLLATLCSTMAALLAVNVLQRLPRYRLILVKENA